MSSEDLKQTKPNQAVLFAAGPNSVGHFIPGPALEKFKPMGQGAMSARRMEWACPRGDLLCLQIIRNYWGCSKRAGQPSGVTKTGF
jgi:hypothetical protein